MKRNTPINLITLFGLLSFVFILSSCTKDTDLFAEIMTQEAQEAIETSEDPSESSETPEDPPTPEDPVTDDTFSTDLKAFPTAYGAGAYTTGGRGGQIIQVTNLNDRGAGSLREALQTSGPRIIVFRVAGVINLESTLVVTEGDFTLAGQTAPSGGITIAGARVNFRNSDNMIIRYVRFRGGVGSNNDSVSGHFIDNAILDHVSVGFGADEAISFITNVLGETTGNITLQRSLMSESSTGGLFGSMEYAAGVGDISVIKNLWYNITHRFPNLYSDGNAEIINNVIWRYLHRTSSNTDGYRLNHINNWHLFSPTNGFVSLFKQGPKHSVWSSSEKSPSIYSSGNIYEQNIITTEQDNFDKSWSFHVDYSNDAARDTPLPLSFNSSSDFPLLGAPVQITSAVQAFNDVTADVGANVRLDENGNKVPNLDVLDAEYLQAVATNTILDPRSQLSEYNVPAISGGSPYQDSDNDGMPDAWEVANGFNPDLNDSAEDADGDGYTNIEEFLNLVDIQ